MLGNPMLKMFMDRYGHIADLDELRDALRKDGLGEFVDLLDDNGGLLDAFIEEHREEIVRSLRQYPGTGSMPRQEAIESLPVSPQDSFAFNLASCLAYCDGKCCRSRSYLMIGYSDIFRLLSSPDAHGA